MINNPVVDIRGIIKFFSPKSPAALQEINASIPPGEIVGLAGPDGSGKTTLLRLIASLLLPTKGSIQVLGHDTVSGAEAVHTLTGYMPQRFGLYEDLTVLQNLTLYADLRGTIGNERAAVFEKLLHFTALAPFTSRLARDLSGGMKQKLGLACALVKKPSLLLLDEPSVGVDPISRRELWSMVHDLLSEGISIIWSTAYLDEAERCQTILLLNEGTLLFSGKPQDLTRRVLGRVFKTSQKDGDRRKLLTRIIREPNVIDGTIQGDDVRIVFKKNEPTVLQSIVLEPAPPRFEDAFIDLLGGGPNTESKLAEMVAPIKDGIETPVVAEGLSKRFGSFTAVQAVNFSVNRGEIFGLLGPNGAGKSTTFKMLCGLLEPSEGKALVNQINVQKTPNKARAQLGYMAQKFSLYGSLTIQQNLDFFAGIYNLSGDRKKQAVEQMIDIFCFAPLLSTSAESLPLGFKQRLALACATMHHPRVLFLDEPTSGVDPRMRREFWNHINGLVQKGITVLVTTHFMDEAEYCDRIALFYSGKIIRTDTPEQLKQAAKSGKNPHPTLEDAFVTLIEEYDHR